MTQLKANEYWQKLTPEQRNQILRETQLLAKPELKSYNAAELLDQLRQFPITAWNDKVSALQANFRKATDRAIELSAPKARAYFLPRKTIKSNEEMLVYLDELKSEITELLNEGDVILK